MINSESTNIDASTDGGFDSEIGTTLMELISHLDHLYDKFGNILAINKKNIISSCKKNITEMMNLIKNQIDPILDQRYINTLNNEINHYNKKMIDFNYTFKDTSKSILEERLINLIDNMFHMSIANLRLLNIYISTRNSLLNKNKRLEEDKNHTQSKLNGFKNENIVLKEQIQQKIMIINELENDKNHIKSRLNEFKNENVMLKEQIQQKTMVINELEENKKHFESKLNGFKNENIVLKEQIHEKNMEINKLKEKNIETIEELSLTRSNLNKFNQKLNNSMNEKIELNNQLIEAYNELEKKKTEIQITKENIKTNSIFKESSDKYKKLEYRYRWSFIVSVILFPILSVLTILFKQKIILFIDPTSVAGSNQIEFWAIKISIVLIGITLISYFLKLSAHYQKLAEQNHQTHIELDALPQFVSDLHLDDIRDIKKDLTLKYFGKELDGSPHKNMSNLISDQMKSATELVKASAEVIKGVNQPATKQADLSKPKDPAQ